MTRDRALAGMVLLIAAAILVLVFSRHSSTRTVVHTHTSPAVVIVQPPKTTPRDSIREPKAKTGRARPIKPFGSLGAVANRGPRRDSRPAAKPPTTAPQKRPVPKKKRKAAPSPQNAPQSGTAPYTPPQRPPVDVTVPVAPVTVCVKGVGGVNC